jgi:hypothetical protein
VETAFPEAGEEVRSEEHRLAELECEIGQQTLGIDF